MKRPKKPSSRFIEALRIGREAQKARREAEIKESNRKETDNENTEEA